MNRHTPYRHISTGNPIANVLVVIVGVLTIGAFIVLGVFAAVALSGVVLLMAAILGIRMWWLGRKLPAQRQTAPTRRQTGATDNNVIEGDFEVISADKDENRPD